MKDRPILFSGSMIRALLANQKTQTRRVVKGEIPAEAKDAGGVLCSDPTMPSHGTWHWLDDIDLMWASVVGEEFRCPYGVPGDLLWVKETWQAQEAFDHLSPREIGEEWAQEYGEPWCPIRYVADGKCEGSVPQWRESGLGKTRVSIHMPRWASRLTLEITDIRVERLQDISEGDALAEGIKHWGDGFHWEANQGWPGEPERAKSARFVGLTAKQAYMGLWEEINGRESVDANPWCWAISFRSHQQNVDAFLAERRAA